MTGCEARKVLEGNFGKFSLVGYAKLLASLYIARKGIGI